MLPLIDSSPFFLRAAFKKMKKQRTRRCIQPQGAPLSAESCGSFMVAPPFPRSPPLLAVDELLRSPRQLKSLSSRRYVIDASRKIL